MTTTPTTVAGLKKLTAPKLKEIASDIFDADDLKGVRKDGLVEMLADYYAREKVQDQLADAAEELDDEELDDDEELEDSADEVDDELEDDEDMTLDELADTVEKVQAEAAPPEPSGETLTAKQVATRIGTDAKTLRKFFRSPNSTVEAVGQGGRYEFAKEDLEKIRSEFTNWNTNKPARAPKGSKSTADAEPKRKVEDIPEEDLELDDDELEESADEVEEDELEDDELEDDELDLELDDEDDEK